MGSLTVLMDTIAQTPSVDLWTFIRASFLAEFFRARGL